MKNIPTNYEKIGFYPLSSPHTHTLKHKRNDFLCVFFLNSILQGDIEWCRILFICLTAMYNAIFLDSGHIHREIWKLQSKNTTKRIGVICFISEDFIDFRSRIKFSETNGVWYEYNLRNILLANICNIFAKKLYMKYDGNSVQNGWIFVPFASERPITTTTTRPLCRCSELFKYLLQFLFLFDLKTLSLV